MEEEKNTAAAEEASPLLRAMASIRQRYGEISAEQALDIFLAEGGAGLFSGLPEAAGRRARALNTVPAAYSKDEIARMVQDPGRYEKELRSVSAALAADTRTYDLIVQTYQGLMKYCWYVTPREEADSPLPLSRRYALANELARRIDPEALGHEILGLCLLYGKVFFTPRVALRGSGEGLRVVHAFLQQLPEDYCRITGRSDSPGKYTVAFNLDYFSLPGTDPAEYGTLFAPWFPSLQPEGAEAGSASAGAGSRNRRRRRPTGWVPLPPEAVLTFEVNDCSTAAAPPMTGLMVSMTQIPAYEAAQMEIVLNPLTSVMTGELETEDSRGRLSGGDPVRVSPATRRVFETLWYRMLERSNTSGIGLFLAPAKNLKLQTVSDSVANTDIASAAIGEQILKSGMSALIPTTTDPKVDVAQLSAAVHARYGLPVYRTFERYFNALFDALGLGMRFHMFGDIFTWQTELENAREGMLAGRSADRLRYAAMNGLTLTEELACARLESALNAEAGALPAASPQPLSGPRP